jgi:hypothetical protein
MAFVSPGIAASTGGIPMAIAASAMAAVTILTVFVICRILFVAFAIMRIQTYQDLQKAVIPLVVAGAKFLQIAKYNRRHWVAP